MISLPLLPLLLLLAAADAMPPEWNLPSLPPHWIVIQDRIKHRCEPVPKTSKLCGKVPYLHLRLPNVLRHDTVREVQIVSDQYMPLVKVGCHPEVDILLCSVLAPVCIPYQPERQILPCRSFCESVKKPCAAFMENYGFRWPFYLNCSSFPPDTNRMCIKSPSEVICASCPEEITRESLVANYCVSKYVLRARIAGNYIADGKAELILAQRQRWLKWGGRQYGRNFIQRAHLDFKGCRCDVLEKYLKNKKIKVLLMGYMRPDNKLEVTYMALWDRKGDFKAAIRMMRRHRKGKAPSTCSKSRFVIPVGPMGKLPSRDEKKKKKGNRRRKKARRRRKKRRRNRDGRRRKNRKTKGTGDSRRATRRESRRRRQRRPQRPLVTSTPPPPTPPPPYSYDTFYYSNYKT